MTNETNMVYKIDNIATYKPPMRGLNISPPAYAVLTRCLISYQVVTEVYVNSPAIEVGCYDGCFRDIEEPCGFIISFMQ